MIRNVQKADPLIFVVHICALSCDVGGGREKGTGSFIDIQHLKRRNKSIEGMDTHEGKGWTHGKRSLTEML